MDRFKDRKIVIACAVAIIVLAALAGFFFYKFQHLKSNPNAANEATTKRLVEKVGKLYALPGDEQPTIAEVKDKEKLKDQAFFQKAENGDYILIYTQAKTALLYREKDNKLINVGPIALDEQAAAQAQSQSSPVSVKVVNGTNKTGRAAAVGTDISAKLGTAVSIDTNYSDAKSKNATTTTVVDINGNKSSIAQQIATAIGGQVGQLPAGEPNPGTDILVIAGP